jgi:excinuclease UvrABC helicase subunit UvrB
MADTNSPGPGRSTSETALNEVKREVARRNEEAHKAARELRAAGEKQRLEARRQWELESIRRVRQASPKHRD